jgi:hypothetical protein
LSPGDGSRQQAGELGGEVHESAALSGVEGAQTGHPSRAPAIIMS